MIETEAGPEKYSFVGGWLCLDFTNTVSSYGNGYPNERFEGYADVVEWGRKASVLSDGQARGLLEAADRRPEEAASVFQRALALREAIHWIFSSISDDTSPGSADLDTLNAELSRGMAHSRIVATEHGFEWGWADEEEALDRVLWPVARSAADLLTSEELDRVRECAGNTCGWLFVDMSRNHSRHWCDMRDCGNRAKVRRYYQRKKSAR